MSSQMTAKKIINAALSSALALSTSLAVPAMALAQASDTSVVNSGDYADVITHTSKDTSVRVSNTNKADITQIVNSVSNTGGNRADGNIGGASISTGNAANAVNMQVQANHNTTGISGVGSNNGVNVLDVVNTGDKADVGSFHRSNSAVNVNNSNHANVNQVMNTTSNTGDNKADENIARHGGGVDISTGNAVTQGTFGVAVNKNNTGITMGTMNGALGSDTVVTNTGDYADLTTRSSSDTRLDVYNHNTAFINQAMNTKSSTGHNKSTENIGGSDIWTGGASTVGNFNVMANSNSTGLGASLNMGSLLNLSDIVNTGDGIDSRSSMNSNVRTTVSNNNYLRESSVFSQYTTTGKNRVDDNIGGGPVISGGAGAGATMASAGNHNSTILGSVADVMTLWLLGSL